MKKFLLTLMCLLGIATFGYAEDKVTLDVTSSSEWDDATSMYSERTFTFTDADVVATLCSRQTDGTCTIRTSGTYSNVAKTSYITVVAHEGKTLTSVDLNVSRYGTDNATVTYIAYSKDGVNFTTVEGGANYAFKSGNEGPATVSPASLPANVKAVRYEVTGSSSKRVYLGTIDVTFGTPTDEEDTDTPVVTPEEPGDYVEHALVSTAFNGLNGSSYSDGTYTVDGITYTAYAITKTDSWQMNNSSSRTCGIAVSANTNGYLLKKIKIAGSSKDFKVYGSENKYDAVAKSGDNLGTTTGENEFVIEGNYNFVSISPSTTGVCYPTSITFYWEAPETPDTPDEPVADVNYVYTLYSSDFDPLAAPVVAPIDEEWAAIFEEEEMALVENGVATFVVDEWPEDAQFFLDRGDITSNEAPHIELGSATVLANGVVTTLTSADFEDYESVLMSLPASANGQEVTFSYVIADNTLTATWTENTQGGGEQGGTTITYGEETFNFTTAANDDNIGAYGMTVYTSGNTYNASGTSFKEGNVTMTVYGNNRLWGATSGVEFRFHKDSYFTLSVPDGTVITEVSSTGTSKGKWGTTEDPNDLQAGWEGEAQSVKFAANLDKGNTVVKTITVKTKTETGIENVAADANAPVVYYNLQGVRVANPTAGVYVRVQGTKASKVLVK